MLDIWNLSLEQKGADCNDKEYALDAKQQKSKEAPRSIDGISAIQKTERTKTRSQHSVPSIVNDELVSETDPTSLECLPHDTPDDLKIKDGNFIITKKRIYPMALRWLLAHKKDLKAAGWTSSELYRRTPKWNKGIAWLSTWEKENLVVNINENGIIEFTFTNAVGQLILQTARTEGLINTA
jgi:hypothetical protein